MCIRLDTVHALLVQTGEQSGAFAIKNIALCVHCNKNRRKLHKIRPSNVDVIYR